MSGQVITVQTPSGPQIEVLVPEYQINQLTDPNTGLPWASVALATAWMQTAIATAQAAAAALVAPTPPAYVPPAPVRLLPLFDFYQRFTQAEMTAIYTASVGTSPNIAVLMYRDQLTAEALKYDGKVDLNNPLKLADLNLLVSAGILAAGRPAQILA